MSLYYGQQTKEQYLPELSSASCNSKEIKLDKSLQIAQRWKPLRASKNQVLMSHTCRKEIGSQMFYLHYHWTVIFLDKLKCNNSFSDELKSDNFYSRILKELGTRKFTKKNRGVLKLQRKVERMSLNLEKQSEKEQQLKYHLSKILKILQHQPKKRKPINWSDQSSLSSSKEGQKVQSARMKQEQFQE